MAKETFWFSHDYEPTSDPKMQAMLGEYGAVGYGIFWRIIEMLHSDETHKLPFKRYIFSAIAKQMQANAKQSSPNACTLTLFADDVLNFVKSCVDDFELLDSDQEYFWSNRVLRNCAKRSVTSDLRSEAGKLGAIAKQERANAKQNLAEESRGEEKRIEESNTPNSLAAQKSEILVHNAEEEILKNKIQFERICMAAKSNTAEAATSLRKYHLHLVEKDQYPKGRKAVFAGFEKWLMNEKKYLNGNGTTKQITHRSSASTLGKDSPTDKF